MTQEDEEWGQYLLSIGVVNLNDQSEIDRKLEEVERDNPEYQSALRDAIEEITTDAGKSIELLSREDIVTWLLSLGD